MVNLEKGVLNLHPGHKRDADERYFVLPPMDLISKDAAELKKLVKENKENLNVAEGKDLDQGKQGSRSLVKVKPAKDPKKQAVLIVVDDGVRRRSKRLRKG